MGVTKVKDSVRCLSLCQKTKSHIRHLAYLLLQCRHKGGSAYAREEVYLAIDDYYYIHFSS